MSDDVGCYICKLKTVADNCCLLSLKNKSAETSHGERISIPCTSLTSIPISPLSVIIFMSSYYSSEYFLHFGVTYQFLLHSYYFTFLVIAFAHLGINLFRN
jgi:hypothetical protein